MKRYVVLTGRPSEGWTAWGPFPRELDGEIWDAEEFVDGFQAGTGTPAESVEVHAPRDGSDAWQPRAAVVLRGSLATGITCYGPFATLLDADEWIRSDSDGATAEAALEVASPEDAP